MRFKNTYELLNFHLWIKSTPFSVWVWHFVGNFKGTLWNSTQNILPIHWRIWFLYNIEILRALRFKSSCTFFKCPPSSLIYTVNGSPDMNVLAFILLSLKCDCDIKCDSHYGNDQCCDIILSMTRDVALTGQVAMSGKREKLLKWRFPIFSLSLEVFLATYVAAFYPRPAPVCLCVRVSTLSLSVQKFVSRSS